MKIVSSLRSCYDAQYEVNSQLKAKADKLLSSIREERWHYESRLKSLESFTQKIETGRFDAHHLEDFFACTVVVENADAIDRALKVVRRHCKILEQRPLSNHKTRKTPDSFQFDDLRLYVKLKTNPALPPSVVHDITFEVQIKTYLQHAWSIATHDLVYKASEVSWAQQRIAYQIKAMLEAAETAIAGAKDLAKVQSIAVSSDEVDQMIVVIEFLKKSWDASDLPRDVIRLSGVLVEFMKATGLSLKEIEDSLKEETRRGRGTKTLNLSPYLVIMQSLINTNNDKLKKYLTTTDRHKFKILLPNEVAVPAGYPVPFAGRIVSV
jgi:ppGpp synthetase/RelA/SpoT-type nucleotidyltranferase